MQKDEKKIDMSFIHVAYAQNQLWKINNQMGYCKVLVEKLRMP